ncbi:hypothetical protein LLH06_19310 [Mucilaginibacter daejeonensis]|uniref:XAC2610-related protein n=1 Tax=Mucilaginibacter daejeonensis TaxID=398049 RepID=UPI001D177E02|nr:hypothetical protein [Mucilaginibacter daejeonensis]UEG53096.1 hypothetical protein LLH06_19310 [Mucilaginibacter daejeonensis]
MKKNIFFRYIFFFAVFVIMVGKVPKANAQPFTLTSVGEVKPFKLQLFYGTRGKGAFVKYVGQKSVIPLKVEKVNSSVGQRGDRSATYTYTWQEMVNGQVNGTYGVTETGGKISSAYYERKKDGRRFKLTETPVNNTESRKISKVLLHGAIIAFADDPMDEQFSITYANGQLAKLKIPTLDAANVSRMAHIEDYDLDGYDDIAFSLPDAGMGVYRTFSIWLYDPANKRFAKMKEPDYSHSKCAELCDVTVDPDNKLLYTACRGGARWWKNVYRFDNKRQLVWVRSIPADQ